MRAVRSLGGAVLFAAMLAASAASAQTPSQFGPIYPWCAQYGGGRGGGTNCYFSNLWQCRQAISGNGGYCYENPFMAYVTPQQQSTPKARRRAQSGQ